MQGCALGWQIKRQIAELLARIQVLEARLAKDSHNLSKPHASDPPFKQPPPRSLCQSKGRKRGGQKGHPGATRALVHDPQHTVVVPLAGRCACGRGLSGIAVEKLPERRQVPDLVVRRAVTEYRTGAGVCACGQRHRSAFPDGVDAPVQCGPGLAALAVCLTHEQHLPYQRTAELFQALAGIALSPATLSAMGREAAARLTAPVAALGQALLEQAVAHADETGLRVGGALAWLHVLCSATLTFYAVHAKRGREALAAFRGILVHDHWSAYASYPCQLALCPAHHLRELIAVAETSPRRAWPTALIALLCEANDAASMARAAGFNALLAAGAPPAATPRRHAPPGRRQRVKHSPAYNLISRLHEHRDEVLRFLTDLTVPFDNNQAERDIRRRKLKQKVSGGFRCEDGAHAFAIIRSCLSTLRKPSIDTYQALVLTFQGNQPMPRLA
ncbi:MAG: IS66 family transposase [Chromatiaceae bacterium]|nr:IS66 family transposase [Chromatiaceae bacterium]